MERVSNSVCLRIFLALSFLKKIAFKVNSKGIGNVLCVAYPLFLFCKEAYGNIRDKAAILRGQSRALTVWSAGSFALRK